VYYIGIGIAQKNRPATEYTEGARNSALNDIASQITVSISSDVLRKVLEKNEQLEEEFQSSIRASATADLEEVELVDTYETGEEYWVYCRLSRADYAERRSRKLSAAAAQSLNLYSRAAQSEREGRIGQALGLYARAFGPIERYVTEPLVVDHEGRTLYLVSEIYTALRTLLDRIEVRPSAPERDAKIGRPLNKPLEFAAILSGAASTPATQLPFRVAFTRGAGECVDLVHTDDGGIARCKVQKVTASDRIQVVEARLDLQSLAGGEQISPVVRAVLSSFALPETRFVLNVSGVEVFVQTDEAMFGKPLQEKRIEPVVRSELHARNFALVDEKSRAALVVSIRADVRKGSEDYGLAFAFSSADVSVLDIETGEEVFRSSISDVKEGSDSFEKAAYRSLNTLARKIAGEMVPRLVEKVQK
jgi:hypothetical protein